MIFREYSAITPFESKISSKIYRPVTGTKDYGQNNNRYSKIDSNDLKPNKRLTFEDLDDV